ncbi:MAG: DNA repair protein RecO [Clostridia bacterium]|nr:DNA repair protein RecO [Clostridia bacterium]
MAFETLNGIVLRYADYKESDRILTVLTREQGLVSLTARGVRSNRKNAAGAVKDVYCCGEFVVYERNRIKYVSSSSVIEAFYPIREDYDRLTAAAQIARMAERTASGEKNDELYSLVYHAFSFLAYSEAEPVDLTLAFAVKLIALEGYEPVVTRCAVCGRSVLDESGIRFSNRHGGSVCSECCTDEPSYAPSTMEALRRMLLLESRGMEKVRLSENMRAELNALLFDYIEYCVEQSVRLKGKGNGKGKNKNGGDKK